MTNNNDSQPKPEDSGEGSAMRPVSRTWIVIGILALLLGLAMGFMMSSLGK